MRRSELRVPAIGLAFFLTAGLVNSAHAQAAATAPSTASPSPVTVSQSFDGWAFRCIYAVHDKAAGPALCLAEQDLSAQDQGKAVALGAVLIGKGQGAAGASLASTPFRLTLMTPLGFSLTHPVTLSVDAGSAVPFVYQACTTQGCLSTGTIPAALLSALRHGRTGHLRITRIAGGTVTVNFSLAGLGGALSAIDAAAQSKAPA